MLFLEKWQVPRIKLMALHKFGSILERPDDSSRVSQLRVPVKLASPKQLQSVGGHIILIKYCALCFMLIT